MGPEGYESIERVGLMTSLRAREMRRLLPVWQRSVPSLHEFGKARNPGKHSDLVAVGFSGTIGEEVGKRRASGERGGVHRSSQTGEGFEGHFGFGDRPVQWASGARAGGSR